MIGMSKISIIRQRFAAGDSIRKIAREEKVSRETVKKYIEKDDFSPKPPVACRRPSMLDSHKGFVDAVLESDKGNWHKQRHTAKKIFERLRDEREYAGGYSTVQRYVRDRKRAMRCSVKDEYNDLIWDPGFAQIDFGEADFFSGGVKSRKDFLVVDFPYSNQGFAQVFNGGTAECLCQGLKDIFGFVGGVPHTMIFDNATAAGRKACGVVKESELFMSFRLHYGFEARFCNPDSGHEKGGVEKKVDWIRHNMFVPIPEIADLDEYNRKLLDDSLSQGDKTHYRKDVPVSSLFEHDTASLRPLPPRPFDVVRYERYKTNKYGYVTIDGCHTYSVNPRQAQTEVTVGFKAREIVVLDDAGNELARHVRSFGKKRTESIDYRASLSTLINKPGSWNQSRLRKSIEDDLRDYLDVQPKDMLVSYLRCMREQNKSHEFDTILDAMRILVKGGGAFSASDLSVMVQRMDGFGVGAAPDEGPELSYYDHVLLGVV